MIRMDKAEDRMSELEDRARGFSQRAVHIILASTGAAKAVHEGKVKWHEW